MAKTKITPPTVITLTLPTPEGGGIAPERATATLLIQRGELAHVRQFHYAGGLTDIMEAIREAHGSLGEVEDNPPIIAEPPPTTSAGKKSAPSSTPSEPTVDIPLKKGKKTVRISHLKLTGGETDAAAYRQAVQLAAILIDGKLWDGETPIRIPDVYALAKRMKYLNAADMALFSLEDFVQVGELIERNELLSAAEDDEPPTLKASASPAISANGTSGQTVLL